MPPNSVFPKACKRLNSQPNCASAGGQSATPTFSEPMIAKPLVQFLSIISAER